MNFTEALTNELHEDFNESITENGAVGYRTTGKNLLDLNFAVASLRGVSDEKIIERFKKAYFDDKILAIKWLFFARDIRGGLGERRLFRTAMKYLAKYDANFIASVIPLIAEYGRFDDMWIFLDTDLSLTVLNCVGKQLRSDIKNMRDNKPISLLAKWLPSVNASSSETKRYAKKIVRFFGISERKYRKLLSELREYLDVVERKMSSNKWGDINYETVPSRANLIYNDAFLRNDEKRRREFLSKLEKGETKINSSVLYPHDIVHKYTNTALYGFRINNYDAAIESMWKSLPDVVQENGNTIVVADGSGSMTWRVGNSNISALEVANSLAIYFAERSSGEFKDKYITFSKSPQLVDFGQADSLRDKLSIAMAHNEVSNTNIEAVFDLVLNTAIKNKMSQKDIPANILIISDMEFDQATYDPEAGYKGLSRLFDTIKQKYEYAGYKIPRLVFWNVDSRTNTIPVRENDMGVALVSGFSVNICKMVMSGKTDPYECLLETINSERYKPVEDALLKSNYR